MAAGIYQNIQCRGCVGDEPNLAITPFFTSVVAADANKKPQNDVIISVMFPLQMRNSPLSVFANWSKYSDIAGISRGRAGECE